MDSQPPGNTKHVFVTNVKFAMEDPIKLYHKTHTMSIKYSQAISKISNFPLKETIEKENPFQLKVDSSDVDSSNIVVIPTYYKSYGFNKIPLSQSSRTNILLYSNSQQNTIFHSLNLQKSFPF